MDKTNTSGEGLQFIFTEKDFYPDAPSLQEESGGDAWRGRFEADRYYALYQMGFEERSENPTASLPPSLPPSLFLSHPPHLLSSQQTLG